MPTVSSPGLGSGLDVNTIISALVAAETQPAELRLAQKEFDTQAKISAVGGLKSALTTFRSSLAGVASLSLFQSSTTSSSDSDVLTVKADETAVAGGYNVDVTAIAKAHSISSDAFAATTTSVGNGRIHLSIGDYDGNFTTTDITIASGADTLADIKQAINDADAGVTASLINDGNGYRLSLVSNETGLDNQIKITVSNDGDTIDDDNSGLSQLTYDKTLTAPESNLTQNTAALDSALTINGVPITSSSNILTDNIDGLTITLDTIGTSTITIADDSSGANNSINAFVKSYNETIELLNNLSSYDAKTGISGTLQGDSLVRNLTNQLRRYVYSDVEHVTGNYNSITDLGITTNINGLLEINSTTLSAALRDNFDEVGRVFARGAYTTDSLLEVNSQGVDVPAGVYQVNIASGTFGDPGPLNATIDNITATATDGLLLEGSGAFSTLSINVLGGSFGDRGQIIVFDGISKTLDNLIESFIGEEGSITNQLSILDQANTSFAEKKITLAKQKAVIEARYLKQYSELDRIMSTLQGTSDFLTSALESLPGSTFNKN